MLEIDETHTPTLYHFNFFTMTKQTIKKQGRQFSWYDKPISAIIIELQMAQAK